MSKKYLAIVLIIIFALTFTSGCVQQEQVIGKQNITNVTQAAQLEEISENDNLGPALQELDELEGL